MELQARPYPAGNLAAIREVVGSLSNLRVRTSDQVYLAGSPFQG